MCYNCGCGMPEDDMGAGHALKETAGKSITEETFKILAARSDKKIVSIKLATLDQLENKSKTKILSDQVIQAAAQSQGMSLDETTKETIKLLKQELR